MLTMALLLAEMLQAGGSLSTFVYDNPSLVTAAPEQTAILRFHSAARRR
jgi:hypothetical protein